jgi:hypothetical protein
MVVIKSFSYNKIGRVKIDKLDADTPHEFMWDYLADDNVVVYDSLFFWL